MSSRGKKMLDALRKIEDDNRKQKDLTSVTIRQQQVEESNQNCLEVGPSVELNKGKLELLQDPTKSDFPVESDVEPYSPDHSEYEPSTSSSESDVETQRSPVNIIQEKPKSKQKLASSRKKEKKQVKNKKLNSSKANRELEGMEEFPTRTEKSRKRKIKTSTWKRNASKIRKIHGESYISSRGQFVPGSSLKDPCPPTCRRKCRNMITHEERLKIFQNYYQLDSYERQRDFIHSNTEKIKKKWTTTQNSKRENTILFYLPKNNEKVQVCKKMFINTIGVKKGVIDIAMKKRTESNVTSCDNRGKHVKKSTSAEILQSIRSHIEKFPVMASHYCREKTQRKYLYSDLNITIMYDMYKKYCENQEIEIGSAAMYRKLFCDEYNLGFFRPRKDQCRICMFYNTPGSDQQNIEAEYKLHIAAKNRARQEQMFDKEYSAKSEGKSFCCNFDLQQVLLVPCDKTNNALFYKQRLKTYNFTIYNTVSHQGDCFMWSEVEGKRGSCEIASWLYSYFNSLPTTVEHIVCYSDRCGGQNLNKYVAAMCLTAVQKISHLKTIDLKFLVKGYSEMECDSMHAAISTEFKRVGKVNIPSDWKIIGKSARRKGDNPYIVHDVSHKDIFDWKKYAEQVFIFRKEDISKVAVSWQKISWMNFSKQVPNVMRFKEDFDNTFRSLNCERKTRVSSAIILKPLYLGQIGLKKEKYNDLINLFQLNPPALPDEFRAFYENLPFQGDQRNKGIEVSSDSEVNSE